MKLSMMFQDEFEIPTSQREQCSRSKFETPARTLNFNQEDVDIPFNEIDLEDVIQMVVRDVETRDINGFGDKTDRNYGVQEGNLNNTSEYAIESSPVQPLLNILCRTPPTLQPVTNISLVHSYKHH